MERSGSKSRAAEATPASQFWAPSSLGFLLVNYPGILRAWPCCSGELLQRQHQVHIPGGRTEEKEEEHIHFLPGNFLEGPHIASS